MAENQKRAEFEKVLEGTVEMETSEVSELTNELTYHRYLMNKDHIKEFLQDVNVPQYVALYNAALLCKGSADGRTYLKELAAKMQLTVRQTSRIVGELKDRGLVVWSHDGKGSNGTYVMVTEEGKDLLGNQRNSLKEFYGKVINRFGKEKLQQLLLLMKEMEEIMSSTREEMLEAEG